MQSPYQPAPDIHVLPSNFTLPGVGVLTVNAYVLMAEEPVLVDTGLAEDGPEFMEALESIVSPADLRWLWLTHDDTDHTGNIQQVIEMAPNARIVTNGMGALRMATWWPIPLERVHAIRPGDEVSVGDRTLRAIQPPLFDNPMSTGILDTSTGALFSVDSFGAILPTAAEDVADYADADLTGGMMGWATFDSPWTRIVDPAQFGAILDDVRRLAPSRILSSHLPAAGGDQVDRFLDVLAMLPGAEPFVAPDREGFEQLVAAMAAMAAAGGVPPNGN